MKKFREGKIVVAEDYNKIVEILKKLKFNIKDIDETYPFVQFNSTGLAYGVDSNKVFYSCKYPLITLDTLKQWVEEDKQQLFICPFTEKIKNIFTPYCQFNIEVGSYYISDYCNAIFILKVDKMYKCSKDNKMRIITDKCINIANNSPLSIDAPITSIIRSATLEEIILLETSISKKSCKCNLCQNKSWEL